MIENLHRHFKKPQAAQVVGRRKLLFRTIGYVVEMVANHPNTLTAGGKEKSASRIKLEFLPIANSAFPQEMLRNYLQSIFTRTKTGVELIINQLPKIHISSYSPPFFSGVYRVSCSDLLYCRSCDKLSHVKHSFQENQKPCTHTLYSITHCSSLASNLLSFRCFTLQFPESWTLAMKSVTDGNQSATLQRATG